MGCRHAYLVVTDLASILLFSGIVFGWTALQNILLREGFYSGLCAVGQPLPCDAQSTALNRAFTFASTAVSLVALPCGMLLDRFGPVVRPAEPVATGRLLKKPPLACIWRFRRGTLGQAPPLHSARQLSDSRLAQRSLCLFPTAGPCARSRSRLSLRSLVSSASHSASR